MSVQVLRPGLLVSLNTRLEGGVKYTRQDLNAEDLAVANGDDSAKVERWETVKVTVDPEEYARAAKVRSKARNLISMVCSQSVFGLLCPMSKEQLLDEAIKEARERVDMFNASAQTTRVSVYVMRARIAENEAEAARAIAGELREIMDAMQEGVTDADVDKIRKAANKAKDMAKALEPEVGEKVQAAIAEAREVAKEIVKKATKKGEDVGAFVQQVKLDAVAAARFAFLDMEQGATVEALPAPARGLDMDDDAEDVVSEDIGNNDPSNDLKMVAAGYDGRKLEV